MAQSKKIVTIKDVAAECGVSAASVSLYVNGKAKQKQYQLSAATCERIAKAIAKLGYVPNIHAQTMVTGKSHLICFCVADDFSYSFWGRILNTFEDMLNQNGFRVLTAISRRDSERQKNSIEIMEQLGVDGFAIAPVWGTEAQIRELSRKYPLVVLNSFLEGVSSVWNDDAVGIGKALDALEARNYRHTAYISGANTMRCNAFRELAAVRGMDSVIYRDIDEFFKCADRHDAVICNSDYTAKELYLRAATAGLRIPDDLAVIGYDNLDFTSLLIPPLSSVHQFKEELGQEAAAILLQLLQKPGQVLTKRLDSELILRDSIGHNQNATSKRLEEPKMT